jgi:hypothetical protein
MNVVDMFYDQYGDSAGMDQDAIEKGGKKYIDTKWPKLDTIKTASVVGEPVAPAAKPAPKTGSSAAKPATKPAP